MIKEKFPLLILLSAILACAVVTPEKTMGRNLFYLSAVLSVGYAAFNIKNLRFKKEDAVIALFLFLMGSSQLLWTYRFPANAAEIYMADVSYGRTGIYLIVGAIVVPLVSAIFRMITPSQGRFFNYLLLLGFTYLTLYALHFHFFISEDRLRIGNSATLSAYLYAFYTMITLYALACIEMRYRKQIIFAVLVFSFWVIFLTQTRSVLLFYPAILIYALLKSSMMSKSKMIVLCLVSLLASLVIIEFVFPTIKTRAVDAVTELSEYQSDNNTSLGARLSMWHTGIYEIYRHPGGVSSQQRYEILSQLMQEKEHGNPEGIRNMVYHLHNDLIETMSLQGVFAGVILLGLYAAMIFYVYRKKVLSCAVIFLCAPVILFGSVDTLFIHDRFIVMFITSLIICAGIHRIKQVR
ncbi:TPA: O-antigen ligase family protein [Raoultella planticola]|nr:O-antigen ligase family protein [Raoultella planticola]HDH7775996.1 O-antigen ligase family protein [Raoultella planticola]